MTIRVLSQRCVRYMYQTSAVNKNALNCLGTTIELFVLLKHTRAKEKRAGRAKQARAEIRAG